MKREKRAHITTGSENKNGKKPYKMCVCVCVAVSICVGERKMRMTNGTR